MNLDSTHIDSLIVRHLTEQLSPEEAQELNEFIASSPENKKMVEQWTALWNSSHNIALFSKIDVHNDWKSVENRLSNNRFTIRPFVQSVLKYAAIIIPLISVTVALYLWMPFSNSSAPLMVKAENDTTIILPDNSAVYLRKGSVIAYINEKSKTRSVNLIGEAFIEVTHDARHPFTVSMPNAKVEVLGTSFDIKQNADSVLLYVETGKVKFSSTQKELLVTPGEMAKLKNNNIEKNEIVSLNFMAWKTGVLIFENATLKTVCSELPLLFPEIEKITFATDVSDITISTRFEKQSVEEVLDELSIHYNKKFYINGQTLVISD